MNVLYITSTFPVNQRDHQVPWLVNIVDKLSALGVDIEIFAPSFQAMKQQSFARVPVYRFRYAPARFEDLTHGEGAVFKLRSQPWRLVWAGFYIILGMVAIIRLLRERHYDAVHVHWPFPQAIFGIIAKKLTGCRLIYSFHGAEFTLARRFPWGLVLLRFFLRQADVVTANSMYTRRLIGEIVDMPVHIIPFAAAVTPKKQRIMKQSPVNNKVKRILFVGRLIERKGLAYLIAAMPMVLETVPAQLDIVGDGALLDDLRQKVEAGGLAQHIFFHRSVDALALQNMYERCDVFVLPSITDKWGDTEGLGVVLLEAMSFGKPVVASNVGGIPDIIEDGNTGLLVPEKDSRALAQAIIKILTHAEVAAMLGQHGYQLVRKKFRLERIASDMEKLYRKNTL